jgi:O-antigen/teichoic acid export membrane protein
MKINIGKEGKLLARHSLIYGIGNFLNKIVAIILLPVYTRYLTPTDYGIKELVGLTGEVIGILLATSISSSIYRFYFEYDNEKDRKEVVSSSILLIGTVGIVVLFGLSFFSKYIATITIDDPKKYYFFLVVFGSVWFQMLNDIGYIYLRANQQSLKFVMLSLCKLLMAMCLNIYFLVYLKIGVFGVFISTLITSAIMAIVLICPLLAKTGLHFSPSKIREMAKFGIPFVPSQFGAFVVHLSDRFFLKHFCSISDAGLYSLGYRLGTIPHNFITVPFNQTWQPRRFELYKLEDSEKVFGRIFTYFLSLIIFTGVAVSVLAQDMLKIFAGENFWGAYKTVPIIVLALTVFSLQTHFNMGLLIKKKTKYSAMIDLSNGLFIIILNFLLIKPFGIYGAAFATLIAFIYKIVLLYYFSSKYYAIHFEFVRIFKIIIICVCLYAISRFLRFENIYLDILCKSLLLCTYPVLLFLSKFFRQEEIEKIVALWKKYTTKKNKEDVEVIAKV